MNAPFTPPADPIPTGVRAGQWARSLAESEAASDLVLASFHRFERAHNAARPPVTPQPDEQYEARPWAKPESMWRPM